MVEKTDVAAVLELIRPSLQADGGDVKLVDVDEDGVVTVELQGACTESFLAALARPMSGETTTVFSQSRSLFFLK